MELEELLVKLSQKGYLFQIFGNNNGLNYHVKKLNDNKIDCRFSIITNKQNEPMNLYWDNPTGAMHYKTYQEVYDYLVGEKCNGYWSPCRY